MNEQTYVIPAPLLQHVVNLLNDLPARTSRTALNAIEAECARQDQARLQKAEAPDPAAE